VSQGLVDVHAHHYPASYLEACQRPDSGLSHYRRDDGRLVVLQDGAVALAAPQPLPGMDDRLRRMDEAGIDVQVISVSAPSVFRLPEAYRRQVTRDSNDELVSFAREANGRIKVLVSLPLPDVDGALDELRRMEPRDEVVGVFLCSTVDGRTLDDERFAPLYEALAASRTMVLVHPGVACCTEGLRDYALALSLDYMAENTNAIARLTYSGTFDRYPGIKWIFSHLGGTTPFLMHRFDNYFRQFPECRERIDRPPSEILRDIYFDTVTTHVPALRCALETLSPAQLLFGTDYPHVPGGLQAFVDVVRQAIPDVETRRLVGSDTARALMGLSAPSWEASP
jgi:predicted TIM-barrel fold metal-dependent hydrolase